MRLIILSLLLMMTSSSVAQLNKHQADSILLDQIEALTEASKYDEALAIVNQLISTNNTNADYFDLRGSLYMQKQIGDSAVLNFSTAILLAPKNPVFYYHRAHVFYLMQMPDESIEDYNKAIKYTNNDTLKYAFISNRGNSRKMKRDFHGAYEDYKMALDFDSTNVPALISLGGVLDDLGKENEAIMHLEKAIRLAPNEIAAIGNLGFRYMDLGDYKKAIKQFNRVLELSPDNPLAYNNMGYAKYKMNDLKNALKDIQYSIKLYPDNSYAYRNRALVYLAMKETDKACEDLQQAINLGYTPRYGNDVQQLIEKHCLLKGL